jgi:YD repeat-containing protein
MTTLTTPNPGAGAYTHTITYDGNSNITKTVDFKSAAHYYQYDGLNRMTGIADAAPTTRPTPGPAAAR